MTFSWKQSSIGTKMIIVSSVMAASSIFMPWVDAKPLFCSYGYQQYAYVLLVFFLYPFVITILNRSMSLIAGVGSSILAAVISVLFMEWKTITWQGQEISFAGYGAFLFFAASLLLFAGILKYSPSSIENKIEEKTEEE